ncbi:MAG TPA: C-GCAxxG-C-C family protein [Candidatus Limnocylindrales bacterium]
MSGGDGLGIEDPLGSEDRLRQRVAELFLDERAGFGCAETALAVLKEAFGLPAPLDTGPAMALNGGIAYSGATCGAVTGAALALGMLAQRRIADHAEAKRAARVLTADLLDAFEREFGATGCRALTGADLRTEAGHRAFIEAGAWRVGCRRQVEFAVTRLAPLTDAAQWATRLAALGGPEGIAGGPARDA